MDEHQVHNPIVNLTKDDFLLGNYLGSQIHSSKSNSSLNESDERSLVQETLLASGTKEFLRPHLTSSNEPDANQPAKNIDLMEFTHHCQVCNKEFYLAKGLEAHIRKHLVVGESNTLNGAKQSNTENIYCTSFQSPKAMEGSGSFKVDKIISLEGTPHNEFNLDETNSVLQQESLSMKQKQQFQSGMMTLENNSVQSSSQTMNSFQMPLSDSMDITTDIVQIPTNPSQMPDSIIQPPTSLSSMAYIPYKTVDIPFHTSTKSVQFPTYPAQMANSIIKTPTIPIPNSSNSQLGNNSWQTSEGFCEIKTQKTGHFKCHLCYYYSDRYSNMLLHIANVHYKKEVMTAIEKCQDLACHLCEYKAAILNSLTNHLIKRH